MRSYSLLALATVRVRRHAATPEGANLAEGRQRRDRPHHVSDHADVGLGTLQEPALEVLVGAGDAFPRDDGQPIALRKRETVEMRLEAVSRESA
jgi:hypothetical protein